MRFGLVFGGLSAYRLAGLGALTSDFQGLILIEVPSAELVEP